MTMDDSGEWWIGSEPADIEKYLYEFTRSEAAYPATVIRLAKCQCGSDRFRLIRASEITQRTCSACRHVKYISRHGMAEDWDDAIEEEEPESYRCDGCGSEETNVGVGFAGYAEDPELSGIKWFYIGVRCASCGILGCFNEGKVGWGPAEDVYLQVAGGSD